MCLSSSLLPGKRGNRRSEVCGVSLRAYVVMRQRRSLWRKTQTLCVRCYGPALRAASSTLLPRSSSTATSAPSLYRSCKELPADCLGRKHSTADSQRHCLAFFVTSSSHLVQLRSTLWPAALFVS